LGGELALRDPDLGELEESVFVEYGAGRMARSTPNIARYYASI
jgi:hypothetical protein